MRLDELEGARPLYATLPTKRRRNKLERINATATAMGAPLMPWQRYVAAVGTEYRTKNGVPYRKTNTVTVPRQSGKTFLVTPIIVDELLSIPMGYGTYTAQTRIAATNRLTDIAHRLIAHNIDPELRFTRGVGNEKITFSNGARLEVQSPKAVSAHGESIDIAVIDEAWKVPREVMAGIVPAMVARPRAQLWIISTQGDESSGLLNDLCDKGREDPQGPMGYFEWSMPEGADIYNPAEWPLWMPALGITTSTEAIEAAKSVLSLPEFRRAFGNRAIVEDNAAAIPGSWWAWGQTTEEVPPVGLSLAVDVNRSPPGWSIAAAWSTENGFHTDLVEHGIGLELSPIPARVRDLTTRFRPVELCIDPLGPAGALVPDLQAIAQDFAIPLRTFNGRERAAADVWLFELLRDERLTHSPMLALDSAADAARAAEKGGSWFFDRHTSYADLSPLLAASMAVWSAREAEALAPVYFIG
jgi:hypothetical protein